MALQVDPVREVIDRIKMRSVERRRAQIRREAEQRAAQERQRPRRERRQLERERRYETEDDRRERAGREGRERTRMLLAAQDRERDIKRRAAQQQADYRKLRESPEIARLRGIDVGSPHGSADFPGYQAGKERFGGVTERVIPELGRALPGQRGRPAASPTTGRIIGEELYRGVLPANPEELGAAIASGGIIGFENAAARAVVQRGARAAGMRVDQYVATREGRRLVEQIAAAGQRGAVEGDDATRRALMGIDRDIAAHENALRRAQTKSAKASINDRLSKLHERRAYIAARGVQQQPGGPTQLPTEPGAALRGQQMNLEAQRAAPERFDPTPAPGRYTVTSSPDGKRWVLTDTVMGDSNSVPKQHYALNAMQKVAANYDANPTPLSQMKREAQGLAEEFAPPAADILPRTVAPEPQRRARVTAIKREITRIENQMDSASWRNMQQMGRDQIGERLRMLRSELASLENQPLPGQSDMFGNVVEEAPLSPPEPPGPKQRSLFDLFGDEGGMINPKTGKEQNPVTPDDLLRTPDPYEGTLTGIDYKLYREMDTFGPRGLERVASKWMRDNTPESIRMANEAMAKLEDMAASGPQQELAREVIEGARGKEITPDTEGLSTENLIRRAEALEQMGADSSLIESELSRRAVAGDDAADAYMAGPRTATPRNERPSWIRQILERKEPGQSSRRPGAGESGMVQGGAFKDADEIAQDAGFKDYQEAEDFWNEHSQMGEYLGGGLDQRLADARAVREAAALAELESAGIPSSSGLGRNAAVRRSQAEDEIERRWRTSRENWDPLYKVNPWEGTNSARLQHMYEAATDDETRQFLANELYARAGEGDADALVTLNELGLEEFSERSIESVRKVYQEDWETMMAGVDKFYTATRVAAFDKAARGTGDPAAIQAAVQELMPFVRRRNEAGSYVRGVLRQAIDDDPEQFGWLARVIPGERGGVGLPLEAMEPDDIARKYGFRDFSEAEARWREGPSGARRGDEPSYDDARHVLEANAEEDLQRAGMDYSYRRSEEFPHDVTSEIERGYQDIYGTSERLANRPLSDITTDRLRLMLEEVHEQDKDARNFIINEIRMRAADNNAHAMEMLNELELEEISLGTIRRAGEVESGEAKKVEAITHRLAGLNREPERDVTEIYRLAQELRPYITRRNIAGNHARRYLRELISQGADDAGGNPYDALRLMIPGERGHITPEEARLSALRAGGRVRRKGGAVPFNTTTEAALLRFSGGLAGAAIGGMQGDTTQERVTGVLGGFALGFGGASLAMRMPIVDRNIARNVSRIIGGEVETLTPRRLTAGRRARAAIKRGTRGAVQGEEPPNQLPLSKIHFREEYFQARKTDPGKPFVQSRVDRIAEDWDPIQLDPIVLVPDSEQGDYAVLAGHHRTGAAQIVEARGGLTDVPVRIMDKIEIDGKLVDFDITNPDHREIGIAVADASNALQKPLGLADRINVIKRSKLTDIGRIRDRFPAFKDQQILDAQHIAELPAHVQAKLDQLSDEAPQIGVAAEVGRGARQYDLSAEEAEGIFNRLTSGSKTKMPTRAHVRETMERYGPLLQKRMQGDLFGDMAGDAFGARNRIIDLMDEHTRLAKEIDTARRAEQRYLKAARGRRGFSEDRPDIVEARQKLTQLEERKGAMDDEVMRLLNEQEQQRVEQAANFSAPDATVGEQEVAFPGQTEQLDLGGDLDDIEAPEPTGRRDRPEAPTTHEEARQYLAERYFSDVETVRAMRSADPVNTLDDAGAAGARGYGTPEGYRYGTHGKKVEFESDQFADPYKTTLKKIAEDRLAQVDREALARSMDEEAAKDAEHLARDIRLGRLNEKGEQRDYEYLGESSDLRMMNEMRGHADWLRGKPPRPPLTLEEVAARVRALDSEERDAAIERIINAKGKQQQQDTLGALYDIIDEEAQAAGAHLIHRDAQEYANLTELQARLFNLAEDRRLPPWARTSINLDAQGISDARYGLLASVPEDIRVQEGWPTDEMLRNEIGEEGQLAEPLIVTNPEDAREPGQLLENLRLDREAREAEPSIEQGKRYYRERFNAGGDLVERIEITRVQALNLLTGGRTPRPASYRRLEAIEKGELVDQKWTQGYFVRAQDNELPLIGAEPPKIEDLTEKDLAAGERARDRLVNKAPLFAEEVPPAEELAQRGVAGRERQAADFEGRKLAGEATAADWYDEATDAQRQLYDDWRAMYPPTPEYGLDLIRRIEAGTVTGKPPASLEQLQAPPAIEKLTTPRYGPGVPRTGGGGAGRPPTRPPAPPTGPPPPEEPRGPGAFDLSPEARQYDQPAAQPSLVVPGPADYMSPAYTATADFLGKVSTKNRIQPRLGISQVAVDEYAPTRSDLESMVEGARVTRNAWRDRARMLRKDIESRIARFIPGFTEATAKQKVGAVRQAMKMGKTLPGERSILAEYNQALEALREARKLEHRARRNLRHADILVSIDDIVNRAKAMGADETELAIVRQFAGDEARILAADEPFLGRPRAAQLIEHYATRATGGVPGVLQDIATKRLINNTAFQEAHRPFSENIIPAFERILEREAPKLEYVGPEKYAEVATGPYRLLAVTTHPQFFKGKTPELMAVARIVQERLRSRYNLIKAFDSTAAPPVEGAYLPQLWDYGTGSIERVQTRPRGRPGQVKKRTIRNWMDAVVSDSWPFELKEMTPGELMDWSLQVSDTYLSDLAERRQILQRYGTMITPKRAEGKVEFGVPLMRGWHADPEIVSQVEALYRPGPEWTSAISGPVSRWRNTAFGFDIGYLLYNARQAIMFGSPQMMIGATNRALGKIGLGVRTLDKDLPDVVARARQGLVKGGYESPFNPNEGTLLGYVPGLGKVDKVVANLMRRNQEIGFRSLMGTIQDWIAEGIAVTAKFAGEDITDPANQLRYADAANAIIGTSRGATRRGRRSIEATALTSARITRSQPAVLKMLTNAIPRSGVSRGQVLAANMSLASLGAIIYGAATAINQAGGYAPPPFLPVSRDENGKWRTNGDWASVTIGGRVRPLIPQRALITAINKSFAAVANADPVALSQAWTQYGYGRATPALQAPVTAGLGYGYDPETGFQTGDLAGKQRLLQSAPLPLAAGQLIDEPDVGAGTVAETLLGGQSYPIPEFDRREMAYDAAARAQGFESYDAMKEQLGPNAALARVREAPDVTTAEQDFFERQQVTDSPFGRIKAESKRTDELMLQAQNRVNAGELTRGEWRDTRARLRENEAGRIAAIKRDDKVDRIDTGDPILDGWYAVYDKHTDPETGFIFDRDELSEDLDTYEAKLSPANRQRLRENMGAGTATPLEEEYFADVDHIVKSGYWDVKDQLFERIKKSDPSLAEFDDWIEAKQSFEREFRKRLDARGLPSAMGTIIVNDLPWVKMLDEISTGIRAGLREADPELARILIRWGYKTPSKADVLNLIESGR